MKKDQIAPLTSLRFIAAALVILYHAAPYIDGLEAHPFLSAVVHQGGTAVALFFVLSGFLITLRYYDKVVSGSFDFSTYMVKRAARILPLYLVLLAIVLLTSTPPGPPLVYATLTQNYFSDWNISGFGVAWTLGVEELFYLLAPLLFALIHRRGLVRALIGATVVMAAIGLLLVQVSKLTGLDHFGGFMASTVDVGHFTLFGRLFDFAAGIAAARLFMIYRVRWSSNWALPCLAVLIGYYALKQVMRTPFLFENAIAVVICTPVVLSFAMPGGLTARVLSWQPFVYGGKISYAMYLIHGTPFIFALMDSGLRRFFVVVAVLSVLAYHVIERPAQRWIVGQWAAHQKRRTLMPAGD